MYIKFTNATYWAPLVWLICIYVSGRSLGIGSPARGVCPWRILIPLSEVSHSLPVILHPRVGSCATFPSIWQSHGVVIVWVLCRPLFMCPRWVSPTCFSFPFLSTCVLLFPSGELLLSPTTMIPFLHSAYPQLLQVTYSHLKGQSWDTQRRKNIMCLSFWVCVPSFSIIFYVILFIFL